MNVIFFGTPKFAVVSLNKLVNSPHKVLAVVTQPDKPKGRGQKLIPSPVKLVASENNIEILQPQKLTDIKEELERLNADVFVVVAYGKLLPSWILNMAPYKCVNIHPSLLPRYRGAAPIERAIMNGDPKTGVTTMQLSEGMDDGPIYLQEEIEIGENENAGSLKKRLSALSADLLFRTLEGLAAGYVEPVEQDHSRATVIEKLTKEEEKIDWNDTALNIHNKIRALSTKPGAYTFFRGKRIKIFGTTYNQETKGMPGEIASVQKDTFEVAASDGGINILTVQPEGKNPMTASEFIRGYKPQPGEKLS